MTTPLRTNLLCDDPGALIAAIPGMLSFHPADSVVLITYTGEAELCLESVLRMDLPPPEHVVDVARQLRMVVANHDARVIEVVVLGGGGADPPEALPHRDLVEHLAHAFEHDDIVLAHAVWSPTTESHATWWCYEDPECSGQVCPALGAAPFANREQLADLLTPDPVEALAPRAAALALEQDEIDVETDYRFVRDTIDELRTHDPHTPAHLDDATIVRLIRAIATPDIREALLAMPLTVRAPAAERLWLILTRATPGPTRAHPASLLGVSAYLRGEGTLATMATDIALDANPNHHLSNTLRHIIECGIPPAQFRTMLAQSLVSAFTHPQADQSNDP